MPSVGAVASNLSVTAKAADYTAAGNEFVLMSASGGARTLTLPTTPPLNTLIAVKKSDSSSNAVNVVPGSGANINGDSSMILPANGSSATLQYDGTNWQLLNTGMPNAANAIAGLPAGGTADQVLKKNSATSYDASWATVASGGGGAFPPWVAGRTHMRPYAGVTTTAMQATRVYFIPLRVPNACTISGIDVYVSSASGSMNIGFYTDVPAATSGGPGVKLAESSKGLAAGVNTVNFAYVFAGAQTIWVGYVFSATPTLAVENPSIATFPIGGLAQIVNGHITNRFLSSTATLPADATTLTTTPGAVSAPMFGFNVTA